MLLNETQVLYLVNRVLVAIRVSQRYDDPIEFLSQPSVHNIYDQLVDDVHRNRGGDPLSGMNHGIDDDDWFAQVLEAAGRDPHVFDLATFVAEACVDDGHKLRVLSRELVYEIVDLQGKCNWVCKIGIKLVSLLCRSSYCLHLRLMFGAY